MAQKASDKFAQLAALQVIQDVANTDKFTNFSFPFSIMDKVGLLIHRVEYQVGSLQELVQANDTAEVGIAVAKTLADPMDVTDPMLVDYHVVIIALNGVAASGAYRDAVFIKDFSNLPGGGILVPPNPLYAFIHTAGAGGVMNVRTRMYFTYTQLADADYWQLVESRRVVSG